jgi:predicted GH43/DUF377 family glycosyl hydrolase
MAVLRASGNPIITPEGVRASQPDCEVIGVFNAGVARYGEEVILLLRVAERPISRDADVVLSPVYDVDAKAVVTKPFAKDDPANDFSDPRLIIRPNETYLTSISHLRLARSQDGVTFKIEDVAAIEPENEYETFGIEDPRITCIDGMYYLAYVAVSPRGVTTALASTRDFQSFERHGIIFHPENKDVAIFPDRIHGKYYALHRPSSPLFRRNDIWIAESPNLFCWGHHRHLMGLRDGRWDEARLGAGAPPVRIEDGWLEIYHGADRDNRYCLGAVLLDGDEPWRVLARTGSPVFEPEAGYERAGFFGHVVFSCGVLFEDDTLKVYYGAADTTICDVEIPVEDVLNRLDR